MASSRDTEYRAGSRSQRFRKIHRGEYVKERMAWVRTLLGQAVLMFYEEGTAIAEATNEPGPTVKVLIPRPKAPTLHWDLTALTVEELEAMRKFFNLAFDTAEPIVRMRDEVAANAYAEGDDSFARLYRQVPQLVVRPRKEREHSEGVLDGYENVPQGDDDAGTDDSPEGRVRGSSSGLVDAGKTEGSSQDNGPTPD